MRKITLLLILAAMSWTGNVFAAKVYAFEDNLTSTPATNWGFGTVNGHSWNYESVYKVEQFRWSATSYSTRTLSSTVLPANSTDGKTVTIELIAKFYTVGNTGASGSIYFLDNSNNAIFGISLARNSSAWQLGRATTSPGLANPAAKPTITDFLNSDQPTVKITATLDFSAKTFSYSAQLGTFDYVLRTFTASGTSVSTSGNAFISSSAANISALLSSYYKSATSGNYTPNGYDLMYLGISNEVTTPTTTNLTVQFKDQNNAQVKADETISGLVVGNLYTATAAQRASVKSGSDYYAFDVTQASSTAVAAGTPFTMNFRKSAVFSTMNWDGTATTSGGLWSDYYQNFKNGTTATGSQIDAALTFGSSAVNKTVTLLEALNLGTGSCNINSTGYSFSGNYGSINGTGALNINLTGTDALTLNTINNLTGATQITGGTITVNKAGSLGVTPNITGATTIISGVSQTFPSMTFGASSSIQGGSYVNKISGMSASSGVKVSISSSHNTANDYAFDFDASGNLASGSELELTGSATETKFGMTSPSPTYLENTKVTLKGSAFLFIDTNQGSASTINIGTLAGEIGTKLGWGKSSALDRHITWSVGAKNVDSDFAGTITNLGGYAGSGSFYSGQYTHLTKVGTGKLTLSGTSNAYNGNLTVNDGEVLISGTLQGNNKATTPLPNTVTVAAGKKLTVTGSLTATNLVLNSDANGTATLVNTGTVTITNPVTVQQYLPTGRNWYVGIPVTDASNVPYTALTAAGATSVSYWDEANGAWVNDYTGNLVRGRGYIAVSSSGSATNNISFSGTLNTGDVTLKLTRTAGKTKEGFNLVANPYPSYLNPCALITSLSDSIESTIWYRTKSGTYKFESVNTASGKGTGGVTGFIPPMQAFWVRVKPNAANAALNNGATLIFTNAMRYHANPTQSDTTVVTTVLKSPKQIEEMNIRLSISNGISSDETVLYTNANASNGYDIYDSNKMSNDNAAIPEIYTVIGTNNIVINGFNQLPVDQEIPLGFKTGQTNSFVLKVNEITNLDAETTLILKDNLLNTETEMTRGAEYAFSSEIANTTTRFSLILRTKSTVTAVDTMSGTNTELTILCNANRQLVISGIHTDLTLAVYNSLGQMIVSDKINSGSKYTSQTMIPGVYVVKVGNETKKVVIK